MTLVKLKGWNKGSYALSARNIDCERCVNLFPSISEEGTGKEQEQAFLQSIPGLTTEYFLSSYGNIRGIFADKTGLLWVVAGSHVLTIASDGAISNMGTINSSKGSVEFESDGFSKVVLVDGANGYIFPTSLSGGIQAFYDNTFDNAGYVGAISANHGLITGDVINITGQILFDAQSVSVIRIDDNRFAYPKVYPVPLNRLSGAGFNYGSLGTQWQITTATPHNLADGQNVIVQGTDGSYAYQYQIHLINAMSFWINFPVEGLNPPLDGSEFTSVYVDPVFTGSFDTSQAAMRVITGAGWLGSKTVTYQDGFFVFVATGDYNTTTTQPPTVFYSNFATVGQEPFFVDPLNYLVLEDTGDPVVKVLSDHGVLWVFKTRHVVVYYDAGQTIAQFLPIQGSSQETGCVSAATIQKVGGILMWLAQDDRGGAIVVKTQGWYKGERCSTQALEQLLTGNPNLEKASAYTYQMGGHSFYCLNVPGLPTTWCFDMATGQWHERGEWQNGAYSPFRVQAMAYAYGRHWAGGPGQQDVYLVDPNAFTINNLPLRWQRTLPHSSSNYNRVFFNSIQVDMQMGAGMWPTNPSWTGPGDGAGSGGEG